MSITVNPKDPDRAATYEIDLLAVLVQEARRRMQFAVDTVVRAPRDTGLFYVCTYSKNDAGRTADFYPEWPRQAGQVVRDGSIQWTARDPADAADAVISSVVWVAAAGLTIDAQSELDHTARVTVSGGLDGRDYELLATITPTVGNARDVTLVVPVRTQ